MENNFKTFKDANEAAQKVFDLLTEEYPEEAGWAVMPFFVTGTYYIYYRIDEQEDAEDDEVQFVQNDLLKEAFEFKKKVH